MLIGPDIVPPVKGRYEASDAVVAKELRAVPESWIILADENVVTLPDTPVLAVDTKLSTARVLAGPMIEPLMFKSLKRAAVVPMSQTVEPALTFDMVVLPKRKLSAVELVRPLPTTSAAPTTDVLPLPTTTDPLPLVVLLEPITAEAPKVVVSVLRLPKLTLSDPIELLMPYALLPDPTAQLRPTAILGAVVPPVHPFPIEILFG